MPMGSGSCSSRTSADPDRNVALASLVVAGVTPRRVTARTGLAALILAGVVLGGPIGGPAATAADGRTLDVPGDQPTVEAAIAASQPGDVIVLAAGTYPGDVVVPEDRPGITIRGIDRNTVVFDGQDTRANAIEVEADDVTLENLTAHGYVENGFYWDGVEGFAGRFLTVWNVGLYGIYAIESRDGVIEHSYVSGAADAAFYVGECNPCNTTLRDLTATLSAVGYSGTNAGGNLVIEDSVFENNATGILPNSFDVGLEPPPQRQAIFRRNLVRGSGSVPTPRNTPLGGYHGIGIGIAGGVDNVVEGNDVSGSAAYGIVVFTTVDQAASWVPSGNRINANRVSSSRIADLALAGGSGAGNCFESNTAGTSDPADVATACSVEGSGSASAAEDLVQPPPVLLERLPEAPPYSDMPAPPAQQSMGLTAVEPGSLTVPQVGVGVAVAAVVTVLLALLWLRRRRREATR